MFDEKKIPSGVDLSAIAISLSFRVYKRCSGMSERQINVVRNEEICELIVDLRCDQELAFFRLNQLRTISDQTPISIFDSTKNLLKKILFQRDKLAQ